jgi:hypothetical protein
MLTEEGQIRWVGPHAVVAMPAGIDASNASKIRHGLLPAGSLDAAVLAGTPPVPASTPGPWDEPGGTTASGDPRA